MAIRRQQQFFGDQRLDVPQLRALESGVAADMDILAGRLLAGSSPQVLRGLVFLNTVVGQSAISLQLQVADALTLSLEASASGTLLWIPDSEAVQVLNPATNSKIVGGWTTGATNYLALDYRRRVDEQSLDTLYFYSHDTGQKQARTVPVARILDYELVISSQPFGSTPGLIPVAKLVLDSQNIVLSVQDCRPLFWRLSPGGDRASLNSGYAWRTRTDSLTTFTGADKDFLSQKQWQDAVMSRLWELGGGQAWFSPTSDRGLKLIGAPSPAVFASTGDNFEWGFNAGSPGLGLYSVQHLHWQGLSIVFENGTGVYENTILDQTGDDAAGSAAASQTALAIGDCLYVDLDRSSSAQLRAKKAALTSLGTPSQPGSRVIIAWRTAAGVFRRDSAQAINTILTPATTGSVGGVRLATTADTPSTPTVHALGANNVLTIGAAPYAVAGNNAAVLATGGGTGEGMRGTGGALGGPGLRGQGTGDKPGVEGLGGPSAGLGGRFVAGPGGLGVLAIGDNLAGGQGTLGGLLDGVQGTGVGTGSGLVGTGGPTNGAGATLSGTGSGPGLRIQAAGTGKAIEIPPTKTVAYSAGRTMVKTIHGDSNWWPQIHAGTPTRKEILVPINDGDTILGPAYDTDAASEAWSLNTSFSLPLNAIITDIRSCMFASTSGGASLTVKTRCVKVIPDFAGSGGTVLRVYGSGGTAIGELTQAGLTGVSQQILLNWIVESPSTNRTVTDTNQVFWLSYHFEQVNAGLMSDVTLRWVQITYTLTDMLQA